jgi:hypothetical protein
MNKQLLDILDTIPLVTQRQDSSADQLADLRTFANRLGMYDAADVITNLLQDGALIKEMSFAWISDAVDLLLQGLKVNSVKTVRHHAGLGLAEALHVVDAVEHHFRIGQYVPGNGFRREIHELTRAIQREIYTRMVAEVQKREDTKVEKALNPA